MARLSYGKFKNKMLTFASDAEFFEALGFLFNSIKHRVEVHWEYNALSGAWADEGRLYFYKINQSHYTPIPVVYKFRLTAGVGNVDKRLNCNEYIEELAANYGFLSSNGVSHSSTNSPITISSSSPKPIYIKQYVPNQYIADFDRGYNM